MSPNSSSVPQLNNPIIFSTKKLEQSISFVVPNIVSTSFDSSLIATLDVIGYSISNSSDNPNPNTNASSLTTTGLIQHLFDYLVSSSHHYTISPSNSSNIYVYTGQTDSEVLDAPKLVFNKSNKFLHLSSESYVLLHTLDSTEVSFPHPISSPSEYDKCLIVPPQSIVSSSGKVQLRGINDQSDLTNLDARNALASLLNFFLQNQISENLDEENLLLRHKKSELNYFKASFKVLESFYPSKNQFFEAKTSFPFLERNLARLLKHLNLTTQLLQFPSLDSISNEFDALGRILDSSGLPYRESDPPPFVCDCQNYLFSANKSTVSYFQRYKRGYKVFTGDKIEFLQDGVKHPSGTLIYLYPSLFSKGTSLDLLKIAYRSTSWSLWMILLTATLLGAATLFPSILVNQLISTFIPYGDYYSLLSYAVLAVAVLTSIFVIQIIQVRYLVRFEILSDASLQTLMIDRLLKIDPALINTYTQGSMQSRVLGLAQLRSIVSTNLTPILTALSSVLFNFIYLFIYSWQLSIIVLISGLVLALSTLYGAIQRTKHFKNMTEIDGNLVSLTDDIIAGIIDVRSSDTYGDLYNRFGRIINPLIDAVFNATRMADRVTVLSNSSLYITYLFLLPAAYYLYQSGDASLTLAAIISFLTCAQVFLTNFQNGINMFILSWVQVSTYWARALDVVHLPIEGSEVLRPAQQVPHGAKLSVVQLSSKLSVQASSQSKYFKELSFDVPFGSSHLLLGPEGCGKSQLMQYLCDVDSQYTGAISIGGIDIKSVEPRAFRANIAFVPQALLFQQGTIFSNIASNQSITKQQFSDILRGLGLADYLQSLPMKLGTVIGPKAQFLPYDIRKKLLLAKALLKRSDLILIDNGLDGIDTSEVKSILDFLKSQGKTVLVTSSNSEFTKFFDGCTRLV